MALNKQNLVSFTEMTVEKQRAIARQGGLASVKARKERKLMREALADLLALPMREGSTKDAKIKCYTDFAEGKNVSIQDTILMAQIIKAAKGDTKAATFLRDTIGESIANLNIQAEVQGEVKNPYAELTVEELRRIVEK